MSYYDRPQWAECPVQRKQAIAYGLPVEINSYKDALEWWNAKTSWQRSDDRPVGDKTDGRRRMRMLDDKSIAFEYDGEVRAIWHPDSTITVQPPTGCAYGTFDAHVMPRQIELSYNRTVGRTVMLKPEKDTPYQIKQNNRRGTNPAIWVVRAPKPVTLHLDKEQQRWLPVNKYHCKPFYWYEIDKSGIRDASEQYHISDFVLAIQTALTMGADVQTAHWNSGEVATKVAADGADILTLLTERRFVEAAEMVRVNVQRRWDPVNRVYVEETKSLKPKDVKAIRNLAYKEIGLLYVESARMVTLPLLGTIENKLKDFGAPPSQ